MFFFFFLIYSSVIGHLDDFQTLANVNNAVMNMEVQITSLKSGFQFLWIPTQMGGGAGSTHSSIFNF